MREVTPLLRRTCRRSCWNLERARKGGQTGQPRDRRRGKTSRDGTVVVPTPWARWVSLTGSKWGPKLAGLRLAGLGTVNQVRFGLGAMGQVDGPYLTKFRVMLRDVAGSLLRRHGAVQKDPCMQPVEPVWRQPLPVLPRNVAGQGLVPHALAHLST
jgi:hypothetical protein